GILGMAAALEAGPEWMTWAGVLRATLEAAIRRSGGEVVAEGAPRIASIGAVRMPGVSAASQLIRLDAMGIAVSAGSACSSGSLKTSHVLEAMGIENASEIIRISIGRETSKSDIDRFIDAWQAI